MEDWHDIFSLFSGSLTVAGIAALGICAPVYAIVRVIHLIKRFRGQHTWRSDLRPIRLVLYIIFTVVFVLSLFVGALSSKMCSTSEVNEFPSPDRKHKVIVYAFDCGATTDCSLEVSLLRNGENLPKYCIASLLYSSYHQYPIATGPEKNFDVHWSNPYDAIVRIEGLKGGAIQRKQDGVNIRFEVLR